MKPWIYTLLLFILPLVVYPFGVSPFEIPKVIVVELAIIILIVLTFLEEEAATWKSVSWNHILLSGILVVLSMVHLIFLRTPTTLMGNQFRLQGVYLLWLLLLFSMLSRHLGRKLPIWIGWISLTALFGSIFLFGTDEAGRAVGSLGEPNSLSAAGIFIWPWLFFGSIGTRMERWKKTVSFVLVGFLIFVSGSRSGLVAFTIQLAAVGFSRFLKWPLIRVIVVCVGFLGASFLLPAVEQGVILENRAEVWRTAIHAGFAQPVFGHGFGNVERALRDSASRLSNNLRYQYVDSSHNVFLDWWVQGGVIGLGIFLLFVAYAFNNFINRNQMLQITLLLGLLTVMSFNPVSIVTLVGFWWVIGQGFNKILDISS